MSFFEKRGDFAREERNELFEIENASAAELQDENGELKPEIKLVLLTLADISAEEYAEYAYTTTEIAEYKRG